MFVLDAETTIDHTQRLTFGSYRFVVEGRCLKEALFYADNLPQKGWQILDQYRATHRADVVDEGLSELLLLTRSELVKELYRDAYKARCLVVGFNLPKIEILIGESTLVLCYYAIHNDVNVA